MSPHRSSSPPSTSIGLRALRWLHALIGRNEYRPCRAIFRPADAAALDPRLAPFVEKAVVVRLVKLAGTGTPSAEEGLYRIVSRGAPRNLRPEREFDFLE
jgi:hypothetical protein